MELFSLVWESLGPIALGAVLGTIPLAIASFVLGLAIAFGVALLRLSRNAVARGAGRTYVSIIRGTPLLVQLFVIFYGLPSIGVVVPPWPSAILALSLNVGGYAAEVIRAAIQSVAVEQWEAGYMIGMSRRQTLWRIIIPQSIRVAVPPLSNTFISLVKDTSLASTVLVTELFRVSQQIASTSYEFLTLYLEAAVVYWIICLVLSFAQGRLERKLETRVAH